MILYQLYNGIMTFVDIAINLFGLVFMVSAVCYGAGKLAIGMVNGITKSTNRKE